MRKYERQRATLNPVMLGGVRFELEVIERGGLQLALPCKKVFQRSSEWNRCLGWLASGLQRPVRGRIVIL